MIRVRQAWSISDWGWTSGQIWTSYVSDSKGLDHLWLGSDNLQT